MPGWAAIGSSPGLARPSLPGMEPSEAALKRTAAVHTRKFADRFPVLAGVRQEFTWAGHLCLSRNAVSIAKELDAGLYAATVCNGLGTARSTLTGIAAADLAMEVTSDATRHFAGRGRTRPPAAETVFHHRRECVSCAGKNGVPGRNSPSTAPPSRPAADRPGRGISENQMPRQSLSADGQNRKSLIFRHFGNFVNQIERFTRRALWSKNRQFRGRLSFAIRPPSTVQTCPVTKAASSEASQATSAATSSGLPVRPTGWMRPILARKAVGSGMALTKASFSSVSIQPGATALHRTWVDSSTATARVSPCRPAFDAE